MPLLSIQEEFELGYLFDIRTDQRRSRFKSNFDQSLNRNIAFSASPLSPTPHSLPSISEPLNQKQKKRLSVKLEYSPIPGPLSFTDISKEMNETEDFDADDVSSETSDEASESCSGSTSSESELDELSQSPDISDAVPELQLNEQEWSVPAAVRAATRKECRCLVAVAGSIGDKVPSNRRVSSRLSALLSDKFLFCLLFNSFTSIYTDCYLTATREKWVGKDCISIGRVVAGRIQNLISPQFVRFMSFCSG